MTISISNSTLNNNAPSGTVLGSRYQHGYRIYRSVWTGVYLCVYMRPGLIIVTV
jgi:hypothetical protein